MANFCSKHTTEPAVAQCIQCQTPICLSCILDSPDGRFCSLECSNAYNAARAEDRPSQMCAKHPTEAAVAACTKCGTPICQACVVESEAGKFCSLACSIEHAGATVAPEPEAPAGEKDPSLVLPSFMEPEKPTETALDLDFSAPSAIRDSEPAAAPEPAQADVTEAAKCARHPQSLAIGVCMGCGNTMCRSCLVSTPRGQFCSRECTGDEVPVEAPAAPEPEPEPEPQPPPPRRPVTRPSMPAPRTPVHAAPAPTPIVVPEMPPVMAGEERARSGLLIKVGVPLLLVAALVIVFYMLPKVQTLPDPWAQEKQGAWYRMRVVEAGVERLKDTGLRRKERENAPYVLVTQVHEKGVAQPEKEMPVTPLSVRGAGEEKTLPSGATKFVAYQSTTGERILWATEGRHKDLTLRGIDDIKRVSEETIRVKDRSFNCLVLEYRRPGGKDVVRAWHCAAFPLGVVKEESPGRTTELVDFGDDWKKRPSLAEPVVVNAWGREKEGRWFRMKTTTGGGDVYVDTGLKKRDDRFNLLATQLHSVGMSQPVREEREEFRVQKPVAAEDVDVGGAKQPCDVVESDEGGVTVRSWMVREGRFKGAVVRVQSPRMRWTASKIALQPFRVRELAYDCFVVEAQREEGAKKELVRTWQCPAFPLGAVKEEAPGRTSELVDFGDDWSARPVLARLVAMNPWSGEKPGRWFRVKTTTASGDVYVDTGLRQLGDDFYVVATQTHAAGGAQPETEQRIQLEPGRVVASEDIDVGGTKHGCDVVETRAAGGVVKSWTVKEGRYKGVPLKVESAQGTSVVTRLDRATIRVRDLAYECAVADVERISNGSKSSARRWICPAFPHGTVREEAAGQTSLVVDTGDDWAKRPGVPVPVDPWAAMKEGRWYRVHSVAGGTEGFTDTGLRRRGPGYNVLVTQVHVANVAQTEREQRVDFAIAARVGSEDVEVAGTRYGCDVVETREGAVMTRSWVVKEGRFKGVALRTESPQLTLTARKLGEETLRVKNVDFACVSMEADQDVAGTKTVLRLWTAAGLPLASVKREDASGTSELVDFGDDWAARPPLAQPEVVNPWAAEKEGRWYRVRTTAPGSVTYVDTGLRRKGEDFNVLLRQVHTAAGTKAASEERVALEAPKTVAEESVEINGTKLACIVQDAGRGETLRRSWIVKDGPFKGVAVRVVTEQAQLVATKLGQETLTVRDLRFPCVVMEAQQTLTVGDTSTTKMWICSTFPLRVVKSEGAGGSSLLIDYGDDWAKRAESPLQATARIQRSLEQAAQLLREAEPLFIEVTTAMIQPPADRARLQALLAKAQTAENKLYDAQLRYIAAKREAPDTAVVAQRIRNLDALITKIRELAEEIRTKLR